MMMRKRTNRCRNTVWDISVISRNKNGETLCGDQCALEWADNDATVILSDGLGSGVKANILSTLTTTMLTLLPRSQDYIFCSCHSLCCFIC